MKLEPCKVKIAIIQVGFALNANADPVELNVVNDIEALKLKITRCMEVVNDLSVDFVIFPEYAFVLELHQQYQNLADRKNAVVISGTSINKDFIPECKIYLPKNPPISVEKNSIAPGEDIFFRNFDLLPGSKPMIFTLAHPIREIKILVLVCFDFYALEHIYMEENLDIIFIPSYNRNLRVFYQSMDHFVQKNPCFIVNCNTASFGDVSVGGSAVFGLHENILHERLIHQGQINELIIADGQNDFVPESCNSFCGLTSNCNRGTDEILLVEVDVNKPFIVRPRTVLGNNTPNFRVISRTGV